jgi:peptide deformylase
MKREILASAAAGRAKLVERHATPELALVADMRETMIAARGAGLAPQTPAWGW